MVRKIVVVDDDQSILEVMTLVLNQSNYEVVALDSGERVAEVVHKENPDLLLLDVWIPGIDGPQILTQLRSEEKTKNLPVILVSAATGIKETADKYKADAYLEKPFSMYDLELIMTQFLS